VAYAIISLIIIIASRFGCTYFGTNIHTNNLYGDRGGGICGGGICGGGICGGGSGSCDVLQILESMINTA
jgi:hypothetical protein